MIMYKLHNFKAISMLSFEILSNHKVSDADLQGQRNVNAISKKSDKFNRCTKNTFPAVMSTLSHPPQPLKPVSLSSTSPTPPDQLTQSPTNLNHVIYTCKCASQN